MAPLTTFFVVLLGALGACNVAAAPIGRDGEGELDPVVGAGRAQGPPAGGPPGNGRGQGPPADRGQAGRGQGPPADRGQRGAGRGQGGGPGKGGAGRGDACASARARMVPSITGANREIVRVAEAANNNATLIEVLTGVQTGLRDAQGGVVEIDNDIRGGGAASQAGRDRIVAGLTAARDGLTGLTSDDANVSRRVSRARTALGKTINAGNRVLRDCPAAGGDEGEDGEAPPPPPPQQSDAPPPPEQSDVPPPPEQSDVPPPPEQSDVPPASGSEAPTASGSVTDVPAPTATDEPLENETPPPAESSVVTDEPSPTLSESASTTTNPIGTAIDITESLPVPTNVLYTGSSAAASPTAEPSDIPTEGGEDAPAPTESGAAPVTVTVTSVGTGVCPTPVTVTVERPAASADPSAASQVPPNEPSEPVEGNDGDGASVTAPPVATKTPVANSARFLRFYRRHI